MKIERATQLLALLGGLWAIIAVVGGFFVSILDTDAIAARLGFASQQQAINLANAVAELSERGTTGARPSVPQGAVIAFDLPISADTPGGCPVGWSPLIDLVGRMIVGADTSRANEFGYRDTGGEKEHALAGSEVPLASGTLINAALTGNGSFLFVYPNGSERTFPDDGAPHNNMPPYMALFYCKKD